jgi:serine protease DegQ
LFFSVFGSVFLLVPSMRADDKPKIEAKSFEVPYRLTVPKHILIRAKINGKGPYNFILDTGAPALFVATKVCDKLKVAKDDKSWGTFDKFEIEGGAVLTKFKGRVEDPFQLEGMNNLGLAGAELHGIIGYTVLARYRMEIDFSKDKMVWTPLDYEPPMPAGLSGGPSKEMNNMAGLAKFTTAFLGKRGKQEILPRGFLGVELAEKDGAVTIKSILDKSPAAGAGLKIGDRISEFKGKEIKSISAFQDLAAKLQAAETITLTVLRDEKSREVSVKTGEGL